MSRIYKLIGRLPVPSDDFFEIGRNAGTDAWRVAETTIGCLRVSTVFLGVNHGFLGGDPVLFETMIMGDGTYAYQTRCGTWDEAETMHIEGVRAATARVLEVERIATGLSEAVRENGSAHLFPTPPEPPRD